MRAISAQTIRQTLVLVFKVVRLILQLGWYVTGIVQKFKTS
jgi:hypothetical protein